MFTDFAFLLTGVITGAFFLFGIIAFLAMRYRRCPSNKVLVVYGRVGPEQASRCFHGGGTFVWPLIQDYDYLDLTPLTISVPLKGALSLQNIRINVPSTFTVAIDTTPEAMKNSAVRLLKLTAREIEQMANEIIFGQMRLTIASLTIEEINQDREKFLAAIRANIDPELRKLGLTLLNVNITDITDESGYIESIGKKAAATAVNQARVDVALQERTGAVGQSDAKRDERVQVAGFNAAAVQGENTALAQEADYNATLAEKEAAAKRRGEVAQAEAEAKIQDAVAQAETSRLTAEDVVPREIAKRKVEIDAEASAEKLRREARGEADAILAVKTAQAEGIRKVLHAKAEGYRLLVEACEGDARHAATMLLVEKLEKMVELQTEAIRNLQIDKVVVWDSGSGDGGGSSTANFASSLIQSLPPLHDIAKVAGLELPEYLGNMTAGASPIAPPAASPTPSSPKGGEGKGEGGASV